MMQRGSVAEFVCLASRSPRRLALLRQLGLSALVLDVAVDESPLADESPAAMVLRLAAAKAAAVSGDERVAGAAVLAADTAVSLDGRIYGKPRDLADAQRTLQALAGRTHEVHTGVALWHEGQCRTAVCRSEVSLRAISPQEIARYWHSGEPRDKAGSYAIQGRGAIFITALSGSYSGVMGLPLYETAQLLAACGYDLLAAPAGSDDAR